jgi:hypothetical protein
MTATLLVSVSGLDSTTLDDCARFADELDTRRVPASWLLRPRPGTGRRHADAPEIGWLRSRLKGPGSIGTGLSARLLSSDALVMHGYDHASTANGTSWPALPSQLPWVGRRGEFASLPGHEAGLRLLAAVRAFDELGLRSDVFAPPRWLVSDGTLGALRRRGFRVCADGSRVRLMHPATGESARGGRALAAGSAGDVVLRGRLLSLGSSESAEPLRCRGLVVAAARTARRGHLVRIAVEAADLGTRPVTRRAILDAIDAALHAGALPATYATPVTDPRASNAVPVPRVSSGALTA